ARWEETSTDIPRFSWERKIGLTVNTFDIGRAMFRRVTARRVCREARSRMHFSRDSKPRVIWHESLAHHLLTRIWPPFFEVAPVFRKLARSGDCSRLLLNASAPRGTYAWMRDKYNSGMSLPFETVVRKTDTCFFKP